MWVRKPEKDGTHSYEVYGLDNEIFAKKSGFTDYKECEREAEMMQRLALFGDVDPIVAAMSLEEVFAEMEEEY